MDQKTKKILGSVCALLILTLTGGVLYYLFGRQMIDFVSQPEKLRAWVCENGLSARIGFVAMVIFQVIVAVIPGEPFELAAGYAFGAWEGMLLCILGAMAGSLLTFWLVRAFGIRILEYFFSREDIEKLNFLKTNPRRNLLFLIIYTLPGTPKDLLGYYAGLTDMRLPVWLLICSAGRIPSVVTSTLCGDSLGTKDYMMAGIVLAVTLVISAAGLAAYNRICRRRNERENA